MATGTLAYGTVGAITITMTNIPASSYWQSLAVENSVSALDAIVGGSIQVSAAVSVDGSIEVYAYGSWDASAYTAGLTGTDAAITWGTTGNTGVDGYLDLPYLGRAAIDSTDGSDQKKFGPYSVAAAFGGVLPRKWGVVLRNNSATGTNATGTGNQINYTPIKVDVS